MFITVNFFTPCAYDGSLINETLDEQSDIVKRAMSKICYCKEKKKHLELYISEEVIMEKTNTFKAKEIIKIVNMKTTTTECNTSYLVKNAKFRYMFSAREINMLFFTQNQ
jgi:hypothetical protein